MKITKAPAPRTIGTASPDQYVKPLETITLTNDDTVLERTTKAIDTFRMYNIPATAFVMGRRAYFSLQLLLLAQRIGHPDAQHFVVSSAASEDQLKIFDRPVMLDPMADDDMIRCVGGVSALFLVEALRGR